MHWILGAYNTLNQFTTRFNRFAFFLEEFLLKASLTTTDLTTELTWLLLWLFLCVCVWMFVSVSGWWHIGAYTLLRWLCMARARLLPSDVGFTAFVKGTSHALTHSLYLSDRCVNWRHLRVCVVVCVWYISLRACIQQLYRPEKTCCECFQIVSSRMCL